MEDEDHSVKSTEQIGRYQVSGQGSAAVLLDTATGRSWSLRFRDQIGWGSVPIAFEQNAQDAAPAPVQEPRPRK
jgi:hypothetical protein